MDNYKFNIIIKVKLYYTPLKYHIINNLKKFTCFPSFKIFTTYMPATSAAVNALFLLACSNGTAETNIVLKN